MACKRTATSELNHLNWNDEDEPEEAGTFEIAPPEVLEKRVVKTARRRLPRGPDGQPTSAFGSFSGFKTAASTTTASPFSFLSKANTATSSIAATKTAGPASNGGSKTPENGTESPVASNSPAKTISPSKNSKSTEKPEKEDRIFKKSSDYYGKLKGLNESVTQWIKSHVDSNPFCILTPIFRDYEKYLKDIEAKHGYETLESSGDDEIVLEKPLATSSKLARVEKTASESEKKKAVIFDTVKSLPTDASMNWGGQKNFFGENSRAKSISGNSTENKQDKPFAHISTENNPFLNKTISVSQLSDDTEKSNASSGYMSFASSNPSGATFSFGQSSAISSAPTTGFSFGGGKPFSFGSTVSAPQTTETQPTNEDNEDDEEPPKPDFKPVTEDDAFFEQRCKVFVKKDGTFGNRGIGVLFLKSTPSGKTQLIVRADNSLGNLLLNTLLTDSIPTKRMNKNTVMLVCLPLPTSEPPPTPVLLRVKTSEDADTLIETLDKNKK